MTLALLVIGLVGLQWAGFSWTVAAGVILLMNGVGKRA